ncbi:transient receptor potential cation channel subfamily A member 1 [Labeo rohita]|uniref:transient receptor potential cation channel subfamily A member 1 n=1 Tax=Labeo rohita TaxID=84645 RepID=UPI0021E2836F|nr:transient receptor potential cation channel subfamily A member 1 [Labeo rohita]XP_050981142.1 transient receptor potential cation channel subfamily A member 1 [Labeo rohita]
MKRFGRVGPDRPDNLELELTDGVSSQSVQPAIASPASVASVKDVGWSVTHLASYARGRWKHAAHKSVRKKHTEEYVGSKYKGLATDEDSVDGRKKKKIHLNKRLLDHFRVLAASNKDTDEVDLQFLNDVLTNGADPNSADKYGQTALHEISRAWNIDVMRFFLERGADFQRADTFGVTPLHVAAGLDYEEMLQFLLERGADIEARTYKDKQTPLHFAAKNDAVGAVRMLLQNGADITVRDYKERTPLQLAANFDRSETARLLLGFGADAGVQDSDGQLCITAMINKMTSVADLAMNQFHVKDRMARQQYYYLHLMEPMPADKTNPKGSDPSSPLELIVNEGKLDLIMHPVVLKLITVKWNLYGRMGAWILLLLNFLFIVSWTTVAISVSVRPEGDRYNLPQDWWRVLLVVLALVLMVVEVYREVMEIVRSRKKLKHWRCWTVQKINEDLSCSHPMWPEERNYLEGQIKYIRNLKGTYSQDLWNIFDWLVYSLLLAVLVVHLADVFLVSDSLRQNSLRLFAVSIIFLWLRLMKHVRAFRAMGPFIVMLGNIAGDVLRFLFLYIEIYIPYACAFWIIFGGLAEVPSMKTVPELLYSLYRITLVDEYEFNAMLGVDAVMAYLLCGTFLALSAILCVNLLIALLSDTFQRVYDNALANAVMQQAAIILQIEESMSCLRRCYDNEYIHQHCAPLGEFYDDDVTTNPEQHAEMKKLTEQIKDVLHQFLNIQRETLSPQLAYAGAREESTRRSAALPEKEEHLLTLHRLAKDQQKHSQDLSELKAEVKELHSLLLHLIQSKT